MILITTRKPKICLEVIINPAWNPLFSCQPQIDPNLFTNELSALFVDALANQFGLSDAEQDLRKNLHGFAKLGHGLSKYDLATRTYLLGSDLIFDPNRITFMTLHFDVVVNPTNRKAFKLTNIYGNPAREHFLTSYTKNQCSSICNSFRKLLCDSVIGDDTSTLSDFIYDSSNHFRRAGRNSDLGYPIHACLAILAEEEDESPTILSTEDAEDSPIREPLKKKHKHGQGGYIVKGKDFWSKVEMWFEAQQKQWGECWGTPG
ncbi:uncharacterized protein F5147DRAFT_647319 [Suillus discolor]|uniref:Uncharacterized protein n=1 Tax=Suillus discolor TaxID=1912936 RepID=A0A9P7FLP2_9AGAM|nr:uncharacterized protein F5147DRAFT_647319 [Suillus discolor]KAG2120940.1 hypothetical protein F5147DRAFT_647319 [Suillus discolor]